MEGINTLMEVHSSIHVTYQFARLQRTRTEVAAHRSKALQVQYTYLLPRGGRPIGLEGGREGESGGGGARQR